MGLVGLRTDLTTFRYVTDYKDRHDAGWSGQPYIQDTPPGGHFSATNPMDPKGRQFIQDLANTGGADFLLRGGLLVPNRISKDVSRLTKMFLDTKSPNGLLFTTKQLMLSRSNVRTQASPVIFNNGMYLPTSTILQAGVNAIGGHLNKQGIDPTGLITKTGILVQPKYDEHIEAIKSIEDNRLLNLKRGKIASGGTQIGNSNILIDTNDTTNLFKYDGGPGSVLGTVGRTRIRRYDNTGDALRLLDNDLKYQNVAVWNAEQIAEQVSSKDNPQIKADFRTKLTPPNSLYSNFSSNGTLDYETNNIENRVNLGNPGKKGSKSSYVFGKDGVNKPLDKLNALPIYQSSTGVIQDNIKNDLVKFRIGVIDNDNPKNKTYIHFRAFIDQMNESYSSNWNSTNYVGRGEELYRYGGGFKRSLNLAWTVAAQSKDELIPMYQKLNYLASIVAPDYSSEGYMRGNLITLTLGGWFFEQVGFIEGINYDVPADSPWEIAIPDGGQSSTNSITSDSSVKEMPHIIKVSGFKFTPLHGFLPKIQKNTYSDGSFEGANADYVSAYGMERYIMLSNGGEHVYRNESGRRVDQILADNYGTREGAISDNNFNYTPNNVAARDKATETINDFISSTTFGGFF